MRYGYLSVGCEEQMDPAGTGSFFNEGEANIVIQHVLSLVYAGLCLCRKHARKLESLSFIIFLR